MEKPVESCRGGSCIFSKEHRIYPAFDGEKLKVFNREVYILYLWGREGNLEEEQQKETEIVQ